MDQDIKFGYFQVHTPQGIGYVCIALFRPAKDSEEQHKAGFSFCSPKDKFNKSVARSMATGRLLLGSEYKYTIEFKSTAPNNKLAMLDALHFAIQNDILPGWFAKSVKSPDSNRKVIIGLTQWTPKLIETRKCRPEQVIYDNGLKLEAA